MSATENEISATETPLNEAVFYRFQYRKTGQQFTGACSFPGLIVGTVVMVRTDHGLEPARIAGYSPICGCHGPKSQANHLIDRIAQRGELEKYANLVENEDLAFKSCAYLIEKHKLGMHLVRVERFFNGSKMIFYFTADSRVDFRALVKDLVQEFRTRVEMRQVGVRHETKMLGGIGTCGRELCCSSFIKNFDSVSIKMAKEQDLPLNPTKISGVCNRLLCCLTYEYETYKKQRKNLPKAGKRITVDGEQYLVKRQMPLQEAVIAENSAGEDIILKQEQWAPSQLIKKENPEKNMKRKKGGK